MVRVRCKRVLDWPHYKVGENGSVWSRYLLDRGSDNKRKIGKTWAKIQQRTMKRGYKQVTLYHEGRHKTFLVHRLVLLTFKGNPPPGKNDCRHIDDNKANNQLSNLRWGSRKRNMKDAIKNGLTQPGEKNARSRLTEKQVIKILWLRANKGLGSRRLARKFGVCPQTIQLILSGINWSHLPRPKIKKKFLKQGDLIRGTRNPASRAKRKRLKSS